MVHRQENPGNLPGVDSGLSRHQALAQEVPISSPLGLTGAGRPYLSEKVPAR